MNRRRPWTRQEESDLLKWLSDGVSLAVIAVRLKRTVMAVQNRLTMLRKRQKPVSET
jgi:DNA-binding CsgD family transcriptional regulator